MKKNLNKKQNIMSLVIGSNQLIKNIEPLIAKHIKHNLKLKVIFVAKTEEDAVYYRKNFNHCFDEVITIKRKIDNAYIKYHKQYPNPEKEALRIEKKYGVSIYKLFFTDRVIGRGFFASGGVRHPKNRTRYLRGHKELLNMAINNINFWEELFQKENVRLVLNMDPIPHQLARIKKIKNFRVFEGKFKNTFSWIDYRQEPVISINDLKKIKKSSLKKVVLKSPYKRYMLTRYKDRESLKLVNSVKRMIYRALQIVYGRIRGYQKSKNTFILDEILNIWRVRSTYIEYLKKVNINLPKLKGKKFIFFPLLTEPEIALHGVADDFFFQLSAINLVSRDLPADYLLVVKEHVIAFGRRPKDFYNQINDLGNVVFADPTELGLDYVKKCNAVACITGTSAYEAIVMGRPVITFSKNNIWNFLNHVYYVNNFQSLRDIFLSIEKNKYPNKTSMAEGANFYKAYLSKFITIEDYNDLIPLQNNIEKIPNFMKIAAKKLYLNLIKKVGKID